MTESHISDNVFENEQDNDSRNHTPPDKMTLGLFNLLCFEVPAEVTWSLSSESARVFHSDETIADAVYNGLASDFHYD